MTNATVDKQKGGNNMTKSVKKPKRLKKYRMDAGHSIYSLGRVMDVDPSTVSYWENGLKFPRRNKLEQLEDMFDASYRELFKDLTPEENEELERRKVELMKKDNK